jgi:hypothetical protein
VYLDERIEHRRCPQGAQAGLGGLGLATAWNGRRAPRGQLCYEVSVGCMRRQHKKKALTAAELEGIGKLHCRPL